jgi:flagellar biogenesis protein FliO
MMDLYLQMVVALIAVTGLILLLSLFFRKRQEKESFMKIVGYQSLGSKKGIAMIKVGQEVLLVGVTATDVKFLKALNPVVAQAGETSTVRQLKPAAARAAAPAFRQPETAGRMITADASDKLGRLKAMKNSLKDALYAAN